MVAKESTKVRALREAKGLLQSYGFNGFSFQHIADLLGIKKPSLYDHFKSKEELGRELVENYVDTFRAWTETIDDFEPKEKLGAIFDLFYRFSNDDNKVCLAAALSADFNSLPKSMQKPLRGMIDLRNEWLGNVIKEGQKKKIFRSDLSSEALAQVVISCGWGSQLLARVNEQPEKIKKVKEAIWLLIAA